MKGQSNSTGPGGRKQGPNGGRGAGRDRKDMPSAAPPPPSIEIDSAADFPPLNPHDHISPPPAAFNAISASPNQVVSTEPVVIPPRGYQTPFSRYSIDDVLHIVAGIKDATLPTSIQLVSSSASPSLRLMSDLLSSQSEHTAAMVTSPNTDLLLRQRTFSIDETRKQMQLGRPVQREAVITGAVDYGSLIYGEDDHSGQANDAAASTNATGEVKKAPVKAGGSWAGVLMKGGAPPPADAKPATPVKAQPAADKTAAPAASTPGAKPDKKAAGDKKAAASKPQPDSAKKEGVAKPQDSDSKKNRRRRAGSHGENPVKVTTLPLSCPEPSDDHTPLLVNDGSLHSSVLAMYSYCLRVLLFL
jgi:hypothetical protein